MVQQALQGRSAQSSRKTQRVLAVWRGDRLKCEPLAVWKDAASCVHLCVCFVRMLAPMPDHDHVFTCVCVSLGEISPSKARSCFCLCVCGCLCVSLCVFGHVCECVCGDGLVKQGPPGPQGATSSRAGHSMSPSLLLSSSMQHTLLTTTDWDPFEPMLLLKGSCHATRCGCD